MKSKLSLIPLALYVLLSAVIYNLSSSEITLSLVYYLPILASVVFGLLLVAKTGTKKGFGQNMFLILLGLFFWMVAETIYLYYFYVTKTDPYPSIADLFFIIGYPPILAGLIKETLDKKIGLRNAFSWRPLAITAVLVIMTTLTLIRVIFYQSASFLEKAFSTFYCLGDIVIILCLLILINLITNIQKGSFANPWKAFVIGALFMVVGDNLYSIFADQYEAGIKIYQYIDMLYISSYFLFAQTLLDFWIILKKMEKKVLPPIQQN